MALRSHLDQERGLLYANGTQSGMHVLDLTADATNPREVGRFADFYVHDRAPTTFEPPPA